MILKTLMEEKQLDFNQPLLSVRRISSTAASENDYKRKPDKPVPKRPPLPFYKSELKSGPVTNPGTVPFVWEKTPGRPKNESKQQTQAVERPSVAPKLPPGRVLKVEQQDSDKVPKGASVTQSRTGSSVSDSPRTASLDNKVTKHEIPQVIEEKASSVSNDEDENYLDALDTLSRTESFFMSCSVSGLSEWDGPDVQPSGNFSTDQQTRDFMIGRFLPAAKAMASETPQIQHNSRKSLVTQEQLKQARKVESGANSRPLNPKWQKVLPHYAQDIGREESEDESDDHDGYENYAPKVCGLFPRFCLLNPVPGLRMEGRIPSSTVHGVQGKSITSHRRTAKEHGRTATYGKKSVNSQSGYTEERDFLSTAEKSKHDIDPHRRACSKSLASERTEFESSCESPVIEKTLYVDSVHKVKTSISCSSDTNLRGDDFDTLRKDTDLDKNLSIDFSIEDSKHLGIVDEKAVSEPEISASLDSSLLVCSDNSNDNMQMEMKNHSNKICPEKQELTKPDYQGSNINFSLFKVQPKSHLLKTRTSYLVMSRYTTRQQRALQAATLEQRSILAREFRQQNSGRNINAPRGNGNTRRRARQNLPQTFRNPNNQLQTVPRSPWQSPQAQITAISGTSFFRNVIMTKDANLISSTSVHPRHVPPLKHYTDLFQEWRYLQLSFRFVSTTATNHAGAIAWAIVANGNKVATSQADILANPGSHKQAVVTTGPWIDVKPCPPGHWYQNIPLPKSDSPAYHAAQAVRHPAWFSFVAVSTANADVGYIEVRYSLQFRQQRDV